MSTQNLRAPRIIALRLATLGLGALGACKQSTTPIQPAIFNNPGDVALICYDGRDDEGYKANPERDPSLPRFCCNKVIGDDAEIARRKAVCGDRPVAHALVTQMHRGEAAAVDLEKKKVLDSDRSIPGYTFVDVGGLPTAIVIPGEIPREPDAEGVVGEGLAPEWVYVAGRQTHAVRAVPSCRFKVGRACGPDLKPGAPEIGTVYEQRLAGEPRDMVLDVAGNGLWVTLPDQGLLAYLALPRAAADADGEEFTAPFAAGFVYYALPGGFAEVPPAPVREAETYRFFCSLDEDFTMDPDGWGTLQMPLSLPAPSARTPRPTLLRTLETSEDESGVPEGEPLLLVADDGQMAVHVYARAADESVSLRASLPVGAPLRDFAVTPEVPAVAPTPEELAKALEEPDEGIFEAGDETRRYLYAIDDRDGSVMAFALEVTRGVPVLTPLRAPLPPRDSLHRRANRADRFSLGIEEAEARALEVVDTRSRLRADGTPDADYCGQDGVDFPALKAAADRAQDAYEKDPSDPVKEREARMARERADVVNDAGGLSLRGVFVMVATKMGALVPLDVHDLDLACRMRKQCDANDAPVNKLGVALERHNPRIEGTSSPEVNLSGGNELDVVRRCPDGYSHIPDGDGKVCLQQDPWIGRGYNFLIMYEGPITGAINNGVVEPEGEDRVRIKAPDGVDLCARGANADDDLIAAIVSQPDDEKKSGGRCPVNSFSSPPRFKVVETRRDGIVLEQLSRDELSVETLIACFSEFISFELRLHDQYLIGRSSIPYQHTNKAGVDGTCEHDDALDPRFTGRAQLGQLFQNEFLAFRLNDPFPAPDDGEDPGDEDAGVEADAGADEDDLASQKADISPNISITREPRFVSRAIAGSSNRTDVLPRRVRYFPDDSYLFVVDEASQGLRRFFLTPEFEADSDSNFR